MYVHVWMHRCMNSDHWSQLWCSFTCNGVESMRRRDQEPGTVHTRGEGQRWSRERERGMDGLQMSNGSICQACQYHTLSKRRARWRHPVCVWVSLCECVCVCAWVYVCMQTFVNVCVFLCLYTCLCVCVCVCVWLCVRVCVCLCLCTCGYYPLRLSVWQIVRTCGHLGRVFCFFYLWWGGSLCKANTVWNESHVE